MKKKKAVSPAGQMTGVLPCLYGDEQTSLFHQAWTKIRRLPLCQLILQLKMSGHFELLSCASLQTVKKTIKNIKIRP